LVDFASAEALIAGRAAAKFAGSFCGHCVEVVAGDGVSYTVPQKIRPDNMESAVSIDGFEKKCDVFFRIRKRYENAAIHIENENGTIILPRGHMNPGEMERVSIPQGFLQNVGSVTVKVVEK
jgi:hypothetical protein